MPILIPFGDGGGGSGSFRSNGIADYNDSGTAVSPITLATDTWTTVPNNGAGPFTNLTYLPSGVTNLMNTATGQFTFSELSLGDNVFVRNDLTVNPLTNNALFEVRYLLGAGANAYTLTSTSIRLDSGSGKDYRFSLRPDMIYMGDVNTKDNPITLQVRLSAEGTLINNGSAIGVSGYGG